MTWLEDLRYGLRTVRSKPGFALVAIATMALGIGATTSIFSVINAILIRPLPYPESERIVMVWQTLPESGELTKPVSLPDLFDWKEQNTVFDSLTAYVRWDYNLLADRRPERVGGGMVTHDFFSVMGTGPILGRGFAPDEDAPGGGLAVVLGHGLWQSRFGGDEGIVGQEITIDDQLREVVGVMPPGFDFPEESRLWTPLGFDRNSYPRKLHFLRAVARLKPGLKPGQAQAEMDLIGHQLADQYPETNAGRGISIVRLQDQLVGGIRNALLVLLGAVVLVNLIACANVANLLFARSASRQVETALRAGLGASPLRLLRQMVSESLVLAGLGGALGLVLAFFGVRVLIGLNSQRIPRLESVDIDATVLAFTFGTALLTGLVAGLVPALRSSTPNITKFLNEGGREQGSAGTSARLRRLLLSSEVAISLILVIAAGLLMQSFLQLSRVDLGFSTQRVLTLDITLPWKKYSEPHRTAAFFSQLLERVQSIPGVQSAGASWFIPLSGQSATTDFEIDGRPNPDSQEAPSASLRPVTPGYFHTLNVPLIRGRYFQNRDDAQNPPVAVINQTLARLYWPDEDPIGQKIVFDADFGPVGRIESEAREIVGVVGDVKNGELEKPTLPEISFPHQQSNWRMMTLVVGTTIDPLEAAEAVRNEVWRLDGTLPISGLTTLAEALSAAVAQPRFNMVLISLFATLALTLTAIGIYGLMSYTVRQRTHEIGVRIALGAHQRQVIRSVIREGLLIALAGLAAGILLSLLFSRLLSGLLFGVQATDPTTFLVVSVVIIGVAVLASGVPAWRAAKVDPVIALRGE